MIAAQTPYENAVDVLNDLAEQHEIFYISNRSTEAGGATEAWLEHWGFPQAPLIATMEDKQPYLSECQYLIDDRAKTLVEFIYNFNWQYTWGSIEEEGSKKYQRKAFGLLFEYNRNLTDIPNVYLAPTWAGIRYYLEKKGVLDVRRDLVTSTSA